MRSQEQHEMKVNALTLTIRQQALWGAVSILHMVMKKKFPTFLPALES
jgi:hypothetical protein